MSLTNPKNVVTEERLSEFYGEILPYLGGMPEALANKFSKGDLYSTSEKIIGCWTDGKPLYQKTFIDTSSFSVGTTYVYKDIGDLTGLNVEDIVSINGTGGYGDGQLSRYPLPLSFTDTKNVCIDCFIVNGTNVRIRGRRSEGTAVYANFIVTIQYTKTTDAANSFKYGNETDYSTEEKIVGTWIDGKPIYQKTLINTTPAVSTTGTPSIKDIPIGVSVDLGFISNIIAINNTSHAYFDCNYFNTEGHYIKAFVWNNAASKSNQVEITCDYAVWSNIPVYITVQYTKTTD